MYNRNLLTMKAQLVAIDAVAVFLAGVLALWFRHRSGIFGIEPRFPWATYLWPLSIVTVTYLGVLRYFGMYRPSAGNRMMVRLTKAAFVTTSLLLVLSFFYRGESYSRVSTVLFIPLSVLLLLIGREAYQWFLTSLRRSGAAARSVLIVGGGQAGRRIGRYLNRQPLFYRLEGFLEDATTDPEVTGVPVIGRISELGDVIDRRGIEDVIIALPDAEEDAVIDLIGVCLYHDVTWRVMPDVRGLALDRTTLDQVDSLPLMAPRSARVVGLSYLAKRGFDIAFASFALITASPVMLLIAAVIKLTSRGPVFYRQGRVGQNGEPFEMLKFRSMRQNNDASSHVTFATDWIYGRTGGDDGEGVHKMTADPRITGIGKVIRKTSLDELPQFINVVKGDMSIVGPRPPTSYEFDTYSEWHKRRLEVVPGITGLWQISGRNELSFEEMVELDIRYIERWSLANDIRIVVRTLPALVKGSGH